MPIRLVIVTILLLLFFASQVYWLRAFWRFTASRIASPSSRRVVRAVTLIGFAFLFAYNLFPGSLSPGGHTSPTRMTLSVALLEVPFKLWFFGSLLGFIISIPFWAVDRLLGVAGLIHRRGAAGPGVAAAGTANTAEGSPGAADAKAKNANIAPLAGLGSSARRRFLEQTAIAVAGIPFAAGTYGLVYERVDLETTNRRIRLAGLPRAFDGFRIAQLSDIHIGPFMSEREIRKVVAATNNAKADLIALTGDFVTWDPATQVPVVRALSLLKAPFGIYGCLGNHEAWSRTEDSITELFHGVGIRILRQQQAEIASGADSINLIGVDFQTRTPMRSARARGEHYVKRYLEGVEKLMAPDRVNILLSHNPNTFDRAAELGIDLSLAGHTHGGQVSLEFVNQNISPSRLITPYVKGWFQKAGSQLYVNRGIGTIGIPIRIGSPPELTVYELTRAA